MSNNSAIGEKKDCSQFCTPYFCCLFLSRQGFYCFHTMYASPFEPENGGKLYWVGSCTVCGMNKWHLMRFFGRGAETITQSFPPPKARNNNREPIFLPLTKRYSSFFFSQEYKTHPGYWKSNVKKNKKKRDVVIFWLQYPEYIVKEEQT